MLALGIRELRGGEPQIHFPGLLRAALFHEFASLDVSLLCQECFQSREDKGNGTGGGQIAATVPAWYDPRSAGVNLTIGDYRPSGLHNGEC